MKKIVLSSLLILSFSIYAIYKRSVSAADVLPVPSLSTSTKPTQVPTAIPTSSPTPTEALRPSVNLLPISTPIILPTATPTPTPQLAGAYKDGTYTGSAADAFYGYIQVQAVISGGKLTDVVFLRYPNDRGESVEINRQAMPYLKQEAIAAQSALVNVVSGATDSSVAFRQSLSSALAQAKS